MSDKVDAVIERVRSVYGRWRRDTPVAQMRADWDQLFCAPGEASFDPVLAGGVPCAWIAAPGVRSDRAIVYFHGGGFQVGSLQSHRELMALLSAAAGVRVLGVAYRLAPEHPFPAAVDDAVAAYRWLLDQAIAPERIVIAGDSAGGGLTVATLLALRDGSTPLPAGGVCISPWVDLTCSAASYRTKAEADPIVQSGPIEEMARAYLGYRDRRTPLASPLFADLRGLPPLLIHVGGDEVLLDDAVQLSERARQAGVSATLEVWDRMIHVWHWFLPMLEEAESAVESIGRFIRARA